MNDLMQLYVEYLDNKHSYNQGDIVIFEGEVYEVVQAFADGYIHISLGGIWEPIDVQAKEVRPLTS